MTEGIKWTLAGILAFLISIAGAMIVFKFGNKIVSNEFKWIFPLIISVLIVLWGGFVRASERAKDKEVDKFLTEINSKADKFEMENRFREQQILFADHKENNEAQINAIHEFMASFDSKIGSIDSKLDSLNSYLLNTKRK